MANFRTFALRSDRDSMDFAEITISRLHVVAAYAMQGRLTTNILTTCGIVYEVTDTLGLVQAWLHGNDDPNERK